MFIRLVLFLIIAISLGTIARAAQEKKFNMEPPKIYAPEVAVGYAKTKDGKKGAVYLVATQNKDIPFYEFKIYPQNRPDVARSFQANKNTFHIMLFYGNHYYWQARYLDQNKAPLSDFSVPKALRVVPGADDVPVMEAPVMAEPEPIKPKKPVADKKPASTKPVPQVAKSPVIPAPPAVAKKPAKKKVEAKKDFTPQDLKDIKEDEVEEIYIDQGEEG